MAELEDSGNNVSSESGEISTLFGKYELGRLLGCGAFAKVYHARNIETGQSFAIKCISKQKIVKGGLMMHIKREVLIMRRLNHPRVVKLFEVLATKKKIYFVMEFAKGGELFDKVAKGRLSEYQSRRYFQQLISAVRYCHSHGVFHRDLKPENLLLDENGDLKVSDFGLSAVSEQIRNDGLLHTLCGTPAYVAPEILARKGYDGAKVDIWSCGIILYVLNAGYLPFNDPNLMVMYRKIYKGEFRCPRFMSNELKRFLSRILDPNPDTRITMDEILKDPWFKKGYKEVGCDEEKCFGLEKKDRDDMYLNAFDIISFSSGFDLSGLFNDSGNSVDGERVVSAESPHRIVFKIEEFAKKEELICGKRKDWNLVLKGQHGTCIAAVYIYRLTETLGLVEVRAPEEMWRKKICDLIRQPETLGANS